MPERRREQRPTTIHASSHALVLDPGTFYAAALSVPLAIFSSQLSGLQALVRYLHEARHLSFSEIASLLGRSQKTVWTTYAAAKRGPFPYVEGGLTIPVARFATRELSPLETIVAYLRGLGYGNADAARALGLDPRTTWTVAQRIKRKGVSLG